jgi:hypothetical protein
MNFAKIAIYNISNFGDTDIFPFPIENMMFYDRESFIENLVLNIENNFEDWISEYPVNAIHSCIPAGYTGYRWAAIIDPLWNAFLLYQVLKISDLIEKARIPISKETVFSYRLKIDESSGKLFDQNINWHRFYDKAIEIAENSSFQYVARFDISDFYNRIYVSVNFAHSLKKNFRGRGSRGAVDSSRRRDAFQRLSQRYGLGTWPGSSCSLSPFL